MKLRNIFMASVAALGLAVSAHAAGTLNRTSFEFQAVGGSIGSAPDAFGEGEIGDTDVYFGNSTNGSIDGLWTVNLDPDGQNLYSIIVSAAAPGVTTATIGGETVNGSTNGVVTSFSFAGQYFGSQSILLGGFGAENTFAAVDYQLVTTTAIPEPESYAMMLAGLGAMGFMARRRKSA